MREENVGVIIGRGREANVDGVGKEVVCCGCSFGNVVVEETC